MDKSHKGRTPFSFSRTALYSAITLALSGPGTGYAETITQDTQLPSGYTWSSATEDFIINNNADVTGSNTTLITPSVDINSGSLTLDDGSTIQGGVTIDTSTGVTFNLIDSELTASNAAITATTLGTLGINATSINLKNSKITAGDKLFSLTNSSLNAINSDMSGSIVTLETAIMSLEQGSRLNLHVAGDTGISLASSQFSATDSTIDISCTTNNCQDAIYISNTATGIKPILSLNNSQLNIQGDNFMGINAVTTAGGWLFSGPVNIDVTDSTITTNGKNSHAIVAQGANININITNSTINAQGENSSALILTPAASDSFSITNSTLNAAGATVQINGGDTTLNFADHTTVKNLSGNTAIAINDSNQTLSGTVVLEASDGSAIEGGVELNSTHTDSNFALSLTGGSTLTGAVDSTQYSGTSTLNIDNSSIWTINAASSLSSLTNSGTIAFTTDSATLALSGAGTLNTGSTLIADAAAIASGPLITNGTVSLAGELQVNNTSGAFNPENITSDQQLQNVTLIDADTAIQGDFDTLSLTTDMPDYLNVSSGVSDSDNTRYALTMGLSWYADDAALSTSPATGDFTLNAGETFAVTGDLVDRSINTSIWDGKTLTKKGSGQLTLSGNNSYSGGTFIEEGQLIAASVNALGSGDIVNDGWLVFDANGAFNLVQNITTHSGATLQLNDGSSLQTNVLTQDEGSTLDVYANTDAPVITTQQATLGGTLNISGLSGSTTSTSVTLIDAEQAIDGNFTTLTVAGMDADQVDFLTVSGMVNPNDNTRYDVTPGLSWYADSYDSLDPAHGTFTLNNHDDSFTLDVALTDVVPDSQTGWDGQSLTKDGAGELILGAQNTYSGETEVKAGTLWLTSNGVIGAEGSQQNVNVAQNATFGGLGTVNGNVINSGNIAISADNATGGTLTINGNYASNDGSLTINSQLGNDDSPTDKLVITGDTSGNTTLYVNNIGGQGAQTDTGIEVVDVNGASKGTFTQGNQVQIGLYEYRLYEDSGDWYLRSQAAAPDDKGGAQYRADIGAWLGNQWMARSLQMQSLYDREGSQLKSADGSVWARFKGGTAASQAANGSINIDNNYSQFQLGSDLAVWNNNEQSLAVGVMGSYINADTDSTGNRGADGSQFNASGNVEGYNIGLYATWYADAATHNGLYVDSWYQYGSFNNTVDNGDYGSTDYDSTVDGISLETGYRYDVTLDNGNTLSVTPQAQIAWQHYDADNVKDSSDTRINGQNNDSWDSRLGVRIDGKLLKDDGVIQPFAEVNWLHTSDTSSVSFNGAEVQQDLPADRAELKVGIQANITRQWSAIALATGQTGSNGYSDLNGSFNLRYNW